MRRGLKLLKLEINWKTLAALPPFLASSRSMSLATAVRWREAYERAFARAPRDVAACTSLLKSETIPPRPLPVHSCQTVFKFANSPWRENGVGAFRIGTLMLTTLLTSCILHAKVS